MFSVFHKLFTRTLLLSYFLTKLCLNVLHYLISFGTFLYLVWISLFTFQIVWWWWSPLPPSVGGAGFDTFIITYLYFFSDDYISLFVFHKSLITVLV